MFDVKRILPILLLFLLIFSNGKLIQTEQEVDTEKIIFRRVVTGHSNDGESVIVSDTVIEKKVWRNEIRKIWGADSLPTFPNDGSLELEEDFSWFPPVGGYRFVQFTLIPDDTLTSNDIAQSNAGMHSSNTIDMLYVISGKCVHKMGDGSTVELKAGDTLIQNGTLHAWFNPFTEPCLVIGVLIGAYRSG
jgi:hypothetical protein